MVREERGFFLGFKGSKVIRCSFKGPTFDHLLSNQLSGAVRRRRRKERVQANQT